MPGSGDIHMAGRVKFILSLFLILLGALAIRAFCLQVVMNDEIISHASNRFDCTVKLSAHRGVILDRRGESLAISIAVDSVAANPYLIKNPYFEASRISKILGVDKKLLVARLKSKKYFVWLKRYVTPSETAALKDLHIKGIGFYKESKRFYPEGASMANVLGIVGMDGYGLEGLELFYNNILRGASKQIVAQRDGLGRIIYARGLSQDFPRDGFDLHLTIDRRVQYIASTVLRNAIQRDNARSGFVIVTNPSTGDIYAMASCPSFDPNRRSYRDLIGHKNRIVVDAFEPGSIIKPFIVSWGLDHSIFEPSDIRFCENGKLSFHHITIHDHEKYGWLSVKDIVRYSSNIGMVKLGTSIGAHDLYKCIKAFNLGATTGIDFPGEARGIVREPGRWTDIDMANIAFGQGVAFTGIQLITAFNAMVNGGVIVKPHLLDAITDTKGHIIHKYKPSIIRRVISPKTSEEIINIMRSVVEDGGTGEAAKMNGYHVFGKTGTAQKIDPITGTYSHSAYLTTFFGGLLDGNAKPIITMLVCIDEPHPYYYASQITCPVFKEIAGKCVNVMNVSPTIKIARKE